jgi:hypothetical protein
VERGRDRDLAWVVAAALVFAATALATTAVVRDSGRQIVDTGRYDAYADAVRDGMVPYRDFEVEYPPGALLFFVAPSLVSSAEAGYFWAFAASMALVGAVAVVLTGLTLRRLGRPPRAQRRLLAVLALAPVAFGGVLLTRFDLVPAALVAGASLLLAAGRLRAAAVVLGLGVAVKAYPVVLLPLLVAAAWRTSGRRRAAEVLGLTLVVVSLAYAPFVIVASDGVADSTWRQLSRPLQVESLGAGALVLLDRLSGVGVVVESGYGSQNLVGTAAAAVAAAAGVVTAAALLALWLAFARGAADAERTVRFGAAALVAVAGLGKVVSPQFLVWLLFALWLPGGRRGSVARLLFVTAAVLTAVWFPWLYFDLPDDRDPLVASLVVARGLALAAALAVLALPARSGNDSTATGCGEPRSRSPVR